MSEDFVLFETELGFIVVRDGKVVLVQSSGDLAELSQSMKASGINTIDVANQDIARSLQGFGFETRPVSDEVRDSLGADKLRIIVLAGLAADEAEAMEMIRKRALAAAEERISQESSREDLQLVHGIQALDEMDRFLNITSERVAEWYSLHFPELQPLISDNLVLAKLIVEIGAREKFDEDRLEGRGLSEKKIEAILTAAERSKGGTVGQRDINRVVGLAEIALKTAAEREKLAEYVESTMKRIAPNTTSVAGATIGARLIAKAGGLDRLARLPASTIQVLGAEKALFRAMRTGSRPPKHGILFQHDAVHTAPKWQRGKIARTLANKIAIAARIDYYRGEKENSLTGTLEKRLDEIKIKYKEPRESTAPQRSFKDEKRPYHGKGRKGRGFYKESRSRDRDIRRRPNQGRR